MKMGNLRNHALENREESGLLSWLDGEINLYTELIREVDVAVGEPGEEEFTANNITRLRLTQIRGALIAASILRYWSATPASEVPRAIMDRDDWPAKEGVDARDHWAKVPVVI